MFKGDWTTPLFSTTLHSMVNTVGMTYVFSQGVNKCAFSITITIPGEVQLMLMLHRRFANATEVLLCESNW